MADQRLLPLAQPLACLALLCLVGCAAPIGADRVPPRTAYRELSRSALTSSQCSADTLAVLHRYDLEKQFKHDPAATLQTLHEQALTDDRRDLLFALAELSYLHASRLQHRVKPGVPRQAPDAFLGAAIYAYLFLLGEGREAPPGPFDRRFRVACDLYNRALAQGFAAGDAAHRTVRLTSGPRHLPLGQIEVELRTGHFEGSLGDIDQFLPADEFAVRGLTVRDRQAGLGAPLIAVSKRLDQQRYPPRFPATLFLRVPGDLKTWQAEGMPVSLELFSTYDQARVPVGDRDFPLEGDTTAPLAYSLNDAFLWRIGLAHFFSFKERIRSEVYLSQPYRRGRVPVVFVHGTMSSPVWWAEMWNTLRSDTVLRERCQFWYFIYNSGNPVSYSAAHLREELQRQVQQLDPEGTDPALRQLVVIGHSQGGLLAKLTATDTGEQLWRTASDRPFDGLNLPADEREALRRNFFFTPLPGVTRVVFIATPHRGSYRATSLVRGLSRRFIKLPVDFVRAWTTVLRFSKPHPTPSEVRKTVPTSLDHMSPRNPWLLALAGIPVAPHVRAHSIIALKGDAVPPAGADGVVKYTSAHVPYVDSEFIVRSAHTCQDQPLAIEEVRRILLEHLRAFADSPREVQATPLPEVNP